MILPPFRLNEAPVAQQRMGRKGMKPLLRFILNFSSLAACQIDTDQNNSRGVFPARAAGLAIHAGSKASASFSRTVSGTSWVSASWRISGLMLQV